MDKKRVMFYDKNYEDYINETKMIRMSYQYEKFEKYLPKNPRILDAGCGSGRDVIHFQGLGADIFGIDYSAKIIEFLRGIGMKNVFEVDFFNAPYYNFFDAIWANDFLPILYKKEYPLFFDKCYDLLRTKGIVFITQRSNDNVYMNGDTEGLSYFHDMDEIVPYLGKKFDLLVMEDFIPQGAALEDNKWFIYIIRKKEA